MNQKFRYLRLNVLNISNGTSTPQGQHCASLFRNPWINVQVMAKSTDTWGQLVSIALNHKTCINTSRQVLEKTLFAINAIFTQDNNLSKPKVEGSL